MIISFSPQRRDDALAVSRSGDILIVNGDPVDLSGVPDGADLPAEAIDNKWFVGKVIRVNGDLRITLILPCGANASEEARFPGEIVDPANGPIILPGEKNGDD